MPRQPPDREEVAGPRWRGRALVGWGQMGHGDDTGVVLAHGHMESR